MAPEGHRPVAARRRSPRRARFERVEVIHNGVTQKERFLTALRGGRPDRIPWACNFDHWLNVNRSRGAMEVIS